jgi:hypothetical protein
MRRPPTSVARLAEVALDPAAWLDPGVLIG